MPSADIISITVDGDRAAAPGVGERPSPTTSSQVRTAAPGEDDPVPEPGDILTWLEDRQEVLTAAAAVLALLAALVGVFR